MESLSEQGFKELLEKGQNLLDQRRCCGYCAYCYEERPGITERVESIERSKEVYVNSKGVLHSYA